MKDKASIICSVLNPKICSLGILLSDIAKNIFNKIDNLQDLFLESSFGTEVVFISDTESEDFLLFFCSFLSYSERLLGS